MKAYKSLFVAAALAAVFSSCAKDELVEPLSRGETVYREFSASFSSDATKTELIKGSETGKSSVVWKAGDVLAYYSSNGQDPLKHTVVEDCAILNFKAELKENDSYIVAYYGASSIMNNTADGLTMRGVVKAEQTGSFADAHASVGKVSSDATAIPMSNITALVKFEIKDENSSYIVFRSNSSEPIQANGKVKIVFDKDGKPSASLPDDGTGTSIKVNLNGPGTYYISMLPVTLATGFTFSFYDKDGSFLGKAVSEKKLEIARSKIVNLGEMYPAREPSASSRCLSGEETANCYVVDAVSGTKQYCFDALYKGNSTEQVGEVAKADVLWCTQNVTVIPAKDAVVADVYYYNGKIYFTALSEGNSVIAAKDKDGVILWSWHIWVCKGYNPVTTAQKYNNNLYFMDRNLGALSNTAAAQWDYLSNGLLYQWGRKDPFAGAFPASTVFVTAKASENGTIDYAVKHPAVFIISDTAPYDWMAEKNDDLWKSSKTMYDPCPAGWRIPDADSWSDALGTTSPYHHDFDVTLEGIDFGSAAKPSPSDATLGEDPHIWYQAAGYRNGRTSQTGDRGRYGFWWSNGVSGAYANMFVIQFTHDVYPCKISTRAYGASVRCVSIEDIPGPPEVPVTEVKISKESIDLELYKTTELSVTDIKPADATDKSIVWSSSDPAVAEIDQTGFVRAISIGECTISATAKSGVKADCEVKVTAPTVNDLSASGTANCYIVSTPGKYKFNATVKGNSTETVGTPESAVLLWKSYGTSDTPYETLVRDVEYEGGYVTFEVPSAWMQNGNFVIAVRDAASKILWSWHIWECKDFEPEKTAQVYNNGAGTLMDRNLGATSATPGDVRAIGLLYQWGRKDPFLAGCSISSEVPASSTYTWPAAVPSSDATGNMEYTLANPTTFITGNSENKDWFLNSSVELYNKRWSKVKTQYDPCPVGWRVPDGGDNGTWVLAYGEKEEGTEKYVTSFSEPDLWNSGDHGVDMSGYFSNVNSVWYPATAYRYYLTGDIKGNGLYGDYWSVATEDEYAKSFFFYFGNDYFLSNRDKRANGLAVRCQKDTEQ